MEKHYAFIKNNLVENVLVFLNQDDSLAQVICNEQKCDAFVWLDDLVIPVRYSSWDGTSFTPPTHEQLVNLGITSPAGQDPLAP